MNAPIANAAFSLGADKDGAGPLAPAERPRREIAWGGAVIGLFFAGILGFAALVPMDAGAYVEGVVAVSGHRQAVQHRDGGIVTAIAAREGDWVRQGQPLVTVSAPELVAAERGTTSEVISLLAMRARMNAELAGRAVLTVPPEFETLAPSDRPLADEALAGQRMLLAARRRSLAAEADVLTQRMAQHSQQIGGYRHQMRSNLEQQALIDEEIAGLNKLVPRGFVSATQLRAVERAASELKGNYGYYMAESARAAEARGEARMQMVSMERAMTTEVASQLRDVQVRLDELQPKLAALREQLARATVRAPAAGRIVGTTVFTEGGVVAAGEVLMEIVPDDRQLVVEGRAAPADADDLRPGMRTQIRFTGIHERNLPILEGRLTRVSADSMEDERSGQRFFKVEIAVGADQIALIRQVRPGASLQPGMPAEVIVPLRKRSALAYLLEPLTQSLWRAGREH